MREKLVVHVSYVFLPVNGHDHGVVPVHAHRCRLGHHTASSSLQQFAANLWTDSGVATSEQEIEQRFSLVLCDVVPVTLCKSEQTLVPNNRQLSCAAQVSAICVHGVGRAGTCGSETEEVEDKGIDDLVGKGIFLLEEGSDEN